VIQFVPWLRQQHTRQDAIGDLARDVRTDRAHTQHMRSYLALARYLEPLACANALEALEAAHREYQQRVRELKEWAPQL
jgi:uncharacterized protein YozE (UPF0346 family)